MSARTTTKHVLIFIISNAPDVLALIIAATLVVKYGLSPLEQKDLPVLLQSVLAILVLLSISGLIDRNRRMARIQSLAERTNAIVEGRLNKPPLVTDVIKGPEHQLDIDSAHEILLSGVVLGRSIRAYGASIRKQISSGASVRIIIVDPKIRSLSEHFARRSPLRGTDAKFWQARMAQSEAVIRALSEGLPSSNGNLKIGFLPFIPGFGITVVNPKGSDGVCAVKLYLHLVDIEEPVFVMQNSMDPHWCRIFSEQFELQWSKCRTEQLYP